MKRKPKYLDKLYNGKTTRERSSKQESRIASEINGRTTINSGATFGENDVVNDFMEVEAKTTIHDSFSLKLADFRKLKKKAKVNKIPALVIDFESSKDSLAVIPYDDLIYLIQQANR